MPDNATERPPCPTWCTDHFSVDEDDVSGSLEFHHRLLFRADLVDEQPFLTLHIDQHEDRDHGLYPATCSIKAGVDAVESVIPSDRLRELAAQLVAAAKVIESAGGTPPATRQPRMRIVPPASDL